MSEAELHVLRARLRGGLLNKARRGELVVRPPIGFVSAPEGRLVMDPDQQIQQAVRLLFDTFAHGAQTVPWTDCDDANAVVLYAQHRLTVSPT